MLDFDDILDGGQGIDRMSGGRGNDTYFVDHLKDRIAEVVGASGGVDTVISSESYKLPNNVENLTLVGFAREATGNSIANIIMGNSFGNTLRGGKGNDTLIGGDPSTGWTGSNDYDRLEGGPGADIFVLQAAGRSFYISETENLILNRADTDFDPSEGDRFQLGGNPRKYFLEPVVIASGSSAGKDLTGLYFDINDSGSFEGAFDDLIATMPRLPDDVFPADIADFFAPPV